MPSKKQLDRKVLPDLDEIELEICNDVFNTCMHWAKDGIHPDHVDIDRRKNFNEVLSYEYLFEILIKKAFVDRDTELSYDKLAVIRLTYYYRCTELKKAYEKAKQGTQNELLMS